MPHHRIALVLLSLAACSRSAPNPAVDPPPTPTPPPATPAPTAPAPTATPTPTPTPPTATPPAPTPASASGEVTAADQARGAAVIGELKRSLVGALTKALGSGPPSAIDACHGMAPALTAALARDGAKVGRATRKPRNPGNAAAGWQADALTAFEQQRAGGGSLDGARFTRRLPDGRVAYAEPLLIQPMCLACHGATIAPDVQEVLAARYPDDRATGYQAGDLRGVAWVELPAAP